LSGLPANNWNIRYAIIFVDRFSKFVRVFLHSSPINASMVLQHIDYLILCYGPWVSLLTDRSSQFVSSNFTAGLISREIRHLLPTAYHPQTNGESEHSLQT
jgi:transposase InsO family protein